MRNTEIIKLKVKNSRTTLSSIISIPILEAKVPLIVLLHGWNSHKDKETYTGIEKISLEKEYAVVRFDFRGHGESGGSIDECTIPSSVSDLGSIITAIEKFKDKIQLHNITFIANSFAAEVALWYTPKNAHVRKLILISPGLGKGLSGTNSNHLRQNFWNKRQTFAGINFAQYQQILQRIEIPVQIIHGDGDKRVPISQSYELRKIIGNNVQIFPISGMGHKPTTAVQTQTRLNKICDLL